MNVFIFWMCICVSFECSKWASWILCTPHICHVFQGAILWMVVFCHASVIFSAFETLYHAFFGYATRSFDTPVRESAHSIGLSSIFHISYQLILFLFQKCFVTLDVLCAGEPMQIKWWPLQMSFRTFLYESTTNIIPPTLRPIKPLSVFNTFHIHHHLSESTFMVGCFDCTKLWVSMEIYLVLKIWLHVFLHDMFVAIDGAVIETLCARIYIQFWALLWGFCFSIIHPENLVAQPHDITSVIRRQRCKFQINSHQYRRKNGSEHYRSHSFLLQSGNKYCRITNSDV